MFLDSVAFTLAHAVEEWLVRSHGAPLWQYFGRISGLILKDVPGFLATIGLPTVVLSVLAWLAYDMEQEWAISMLFGARIGDASINHGLFWLIGYRPNPGQTTASIYLIEAAGIGYNLGVGEPWFAALGFAMFAGTVPVMWGIKRLINENN